MTPVGHPIFDRIRARISAVAEAQRADSDGQGGHRRWHAPVSRSATILMTALVSTALLGACSSDAPAVSGSDSTATGRGDTDADSGAPPERDYGTICTALDAALAGDVDAARASFDHGPLHELADAAIEVDRATAARLLQAKEAVERDLADEGLPADQVADDLRTLVDATNAAVAAIGEAAPELCEQETP